MVTKGNTTKGTKGGNTPKVPTVPTTSNFVVPVPTTVNRMVNSTVTNPVGRGWGTMLQLTQTGKGLPGRGVLTSTLTTLGVGYNTTRTQVQKYRRWYFSGGTFCNLPKGVTLPKGFTFGG